MSKAMTFEQFGELLTFLRVCCDPLKPHPCYIAVKYVDPIFDMRSKDCFSITFRTWGRGDIQLHCCNEQHDLPDNLFLRCLNALTKENYATTDIPSTPTV